MVVTSLWDFLLFVLIGACCCFDLLVLLVCCGVGGCVMRSFRFGLLVVGWFAV